jgi:hypothetical protein
MSVATAEVNGTPSMTASRPDSNSTTATDRRVTSGDSPTVWQMRADDLAEPAVDRVGSRGA